MQIEGSVVNEGLYTFNSSVRLNDLINAAGGLKEDADLDKINLAKKIVDGEKIIIYPKISEITESINANKINIIYATKDELMTLDGIGESTAIKIIEYRDNFGITAIEDLLNVDGIGENKYNKIKEKLCI